MVASKPLQPPRQVLLSLVMETTRIILLPTPIYVWVLFALLLFLGVCRLRPRRTHLALAALAPMGFFTWSASTAGLLFFGGGKGSALVAWPIAFLVRTQRACSHCPASDTCAQCQGTQSAPVG